MHIVCKILRCELQTIFGQNLRWNPELRHLIVDKDGCFCGCGAFVVRLAFISFKTLSVNTMVNKLLYFLFGERPSTSTEKTSSGSFVVIRQSFLSHICTKSSRTKLKVTYCSIYVNFQLRSVTPFYHWVILTPSATVFYCMRKAAEMQYAGLNNHGQASSWYHVYRLYPD